MPPHIRTTREAILDAAVKITRERGADAVNARELAKRLKCSIQPIFRNFQSMDHLKKELYKKAEIIFYETMTREVERHGIPFLGMSLAYIEFANAEKNLYAFLFLSGASEDSRIFDRMKEEESQEVIDTISGMTGLNMLQSRQLFTDIWIVTRGVAALIATSHTEFSEEEVVKLLNVLVDSFMGIPHELRKRGESGAQI